MNTRAMEATALELVAPGKGILAADESVPTIEKRFRSVGVVSTPETRRRYRELLVGAPGIGAFISGVILFDETLRQKTREETSFADLLQRQGIIPGIKVDRGTKNLPGFSDEKITEGLDGLHDRLVEYGVMGARFSKWRAVLAIGRDRPSATCVRDNIHALARFAAVSQDAGLVPIVEPEVLMDGDHTIERHHEVTAEVLSALFRELFVQRVQLEALLLKVNMVLPGTTAAHQSGTTEIAHATWHCLRRTVPAAVPGVVLLSGGQGDIQATGRLDALNRIGRMPWDLSFSFGRALQAPALKLWAGQEANIELAQAALIHRARCNSAARFGQYLPAMENSHV